MAFPGNISIVTVTGQFADYAGTPIAGQIKFSLSTALRNQIADQIVIPSVVSLTLDSNGAFTVQLPASDDADFTPTGFTYTVEEAFPNGTTYTISLPASPSTTTLGQLRPDTSSLPFTALASGLAFQDLTNRVTATETYLSARTNAGWVTYLSDGLTTITGYRNNALASQASAEASLATITARNVPAPLFLIGA